MSDQIVGSARAGKVVVFEESARDGAQAKTFMGAVLRTAISSPTSSTACTPPDV